MSFTANKCSTRKVKHFAHKYLYIELRLLVEGLAVVALAAEMIDAVVDVVVVLVVVLRYHLASVMHVVERRVIGAAVVLVLGQIGVRQQGGREMLEAGVVGIDDAATAGRQVTFFRRVRPVGRCELVRRVSVRRVASCNSSALVLSIGRN